MANNISVIIDKLGNEVSAEVGNMHEDELSAITNSFDKTLADALRSFKSSSFDNDGFIKKMTDLNIDKKDKDMVKNVLNNLKQEYIDASSLNQSELLLRRDMFNICTQMPEMRDVIYVVRDAIIECNVSTGEVSRSITFENSNDGDNAKYEAQVKEIELRHDLLMAIKNFIVPKALMAGEMYIHVVPYAKIFAEIEAVKNNKQSNQKKPNFSKDEKPFIENVPTNLLDSFSEATSLYTEDNLKLLTESVSPITKIDSSDVYAIEQENSNITTPEKLKKHSNECVKSILENISVCKASSVLMQEMGAEGLRDFILQDYVNNSPAISNKETHFTEAMGDNKIGGTMFGNLKEDDINIKEYSHIKGCYIKYLDSLRMVPIRMDRKVIGYYYVTTTMDLAVNPAQPKGIVDLSYQNYTRDKNLVDNLSSMIINHLIKKC